jgi:hypothetical protein
MQDYFRDVIARGECGFDCYHEEIRDFSPEFCFI